jgi:hypothetical protein
MDLLSVYPYLEGSHGKLHLKLSPPMLDQLCDLWKARTRGRVHEVRIVPTGVNRFRLKAQLSNRFLHRVGSLAFRLLREEGMEIHIHQTTASFLMPTIEGSTDMTFIGRDYGLPLLVDAFNDALGVEQAVEVKKSKWLGWTQHRVFVAVHPFRILRKILPGDMGRHVSEIRWQSTAEAVSLEVTWRHDGWRPLTQP